MIALLKYNFNIYKKCNKFLIPFILFCLIQAFYYSTGPVDFTSGIMVSANIVLFIMSWIGFIYCETQDWRTEQIVFLKVKNKKVYWISKILFIWIIGIIISLVGTIWPVVINIFNSQTTLKTQISLNEVLLALIIQILVAFMGTLIGMIFQTKIIRNRNISIMIIFAFALLSAIKGPLIKEIPIAKAITWILPPVNDVISSCIGLGNFSLRLLVIPIIYSVGYILVQIVIYIKAMEKLLF